MTTLTFITGNVLGNLTISGSASFFVGGVPVKNSSSSGSVRLDNKVSSKMRVTLFRLTIVCCVVKIEAVASVLSLHSLRYNHCHCRRKQINRTLGNDCKTFDPKPFLSLSQTVFCNPIVNAVFDCTEGRRGRWLLAKRPWSVVHC